MIDRKRRTRDRPTSRFAILAAALTLVLGLASAPAGVFGATRVAPADDPAAISRLAGGAAPASLSEWTGGLNLYREGVFTTQASWLYCTAADVQMIRNMVEGASDHSASNQTTYFNWMRARNKYDLPLSAGWTRPAGPPACATSSTTATPSSRARRSPTRSGRP